MATLKNTDDFHYAKKAIMCYHINTFCCQQRWDTLEECIEHIVVCQKAPLGLKWCLTEKNQAHSLSHCWVTLLWRHQSVTHSVSRKFYQLKIFKILQQLYESIYGQSVTNTVPLRSWKSRLVFEWCYFIGHAYSFIIPSINY